VKMVLSKLKTLKRTKSKIKKENDSSRLHHYYRCQNNTSRIFRNQKEILFHNNSLSLVNNKNILKYCSDTMLFYNMPIRQDLRSYKIKIAHFDGRFADCPKPYRQSVELRLVLFKKDREITVTFARALLTGCKTKNYVEFFERVKKAHSKRIPTLMVDFERAIHNAVRQVFSSTNIRGCWYHFWNNLLRMNGRLKRYTGRETDSNTIRVLALTGFFYYPEILLHFIVSHLWKQDQEVRFRDVTFKLIVYLHRIYLQRHKNEFFINLKTCLVRTNNSCEGSNAGQSKFTSQKMTLSDYRDYTEISFKKDLEKVPTVIKQRSNLDEVLIQIQTISEYNTEDLASFLLKFCENPENKIENLFQTLPSFAKTDKRIMVKKAHTCKNILDNEVNLYRRYRKERRDKWKMFHKIPTTVFQLRGVQRYLSNFQNGKSTDLVLKSNIESDVSQIHDESRIILEEDYSSEDDNDQHKVSNNWIDSFLDNKSESQDFFTYYTDTSDMQMRHKRTRNSLPF